MRCLTFSQIFNFPLKNEKIGPCPVVVMTRTSQLRAKLVSSNNRNNSNYSNANSLNPSVCSVKSTEKQGRNRFFHGFSRIRDGPVEV